MHHKTASLLGLLKKCNLALLTLTLVLFPKLSSAQTPGTLDSTFGTGGKVTTDFGGNSAARAVAVQANGQILTAGVAGLNGVANFALARYNSDGTLDTSFGTAGIVTTPFDFPGNFDIVFTVVRQPDGKFLAVGSTVGNPFANFALARFNADGALDASFGTGGIVTTGFGVSAEATSAVVQADGKIVAAGFANLDGGESFALARYNSDGTLDTTFGTGGKVGTAFASGSASYTQAFSVAIQPDGKIVAVGYTEIGPCLFNGLDLPCFDFALARYNSNGTLDASFGTAGRVTTDFGGPSDQAGSVAVQPDGRIVVAGAAGRFTNRGFDFALARYSSNGTLDTSFGTSGKVFTDFAGDNDTPSEPSALAIQSDGKIIVVGQTVVGNFNNVALARYNSDGTLDTSFGTSGKATTDFAGANDSAVSAAVQSDGNIVVAGGATINGRTDFALARYVGGAVRSTPTVTLSATSLAFGRRVLGTTSPAKVVTLTNTGAGTLNVSSISVNGDFAISSKTCGTTVAPAASCTVSVTFTPTLIGVRNGTLTFNDNAATNRQTVALTGTGTQISLSPASLNFATVAVESTSAAKSVTVTNVGTTPVTLTSISLAGTNPADYQISANTCGTSLAARGSCMVSVRFKPTAAATRKATLSVADNGGGSPQTTSLNGVGQ